jgi:hypothetical protein
MKRFLHLSLLTASIAYTVAAAPILNFTLDPPDGLLSGSPGSSVGWGYTIGTDSDYLLISSFAFFDSTIGTFSSPDVPISIISLGSSVSQSWVRDTSGLQYDILPSALVGAAAQSVIQLTYDAYSDPDLTNQIVFGGTVNAQLSGQDVLAQVNVVVPEPSTVFLAIAGTATVAFLRRRGAKVVRR